MKKYLSVIGKVLLYLMIYFIPQFIGGIIIGTYCSIAYGKTVSQVRLIEIINSKIYYAATIGAIMALIIYIVIYKGKEQNLWEKCQFKKTNLKNSMYCILAALGTAMLTSSFVHLAHSYFKSYEAVSKNIQTGMTSALGIICVVILMPVFEEILFRGLIFNEFRRTMNIVVSIVFQALIFALAHGNMLQGIYTFMLGIILALVYMWTKSIWCNILVHISYNLMGALIVPMLLYYTPKFATLYIVIGILLLIFALMKLYKNRKNKNLLINI